MGRALSPQIIRHISSVTSSTCNHSAKQPRKGLRLIFLNISVNLIYSPQHCTPYQICQITLEYFYSLNTRVSDGTNQCVRMVPIVHRRNPSRLHRWTVNHSADPVEPNTLQQHTDLTAKHTDTHPNEAEYVKLGSDNWARMHDVVLVYAETSGYVGTSKSETSWGS